MKQLFLTLTLLLCLSQSGTAQVRKLLSAGEGMTSEWVVEAQDPATEITLKGESMEIIATKGLTLWYDMRLKGDYQISYNVKFVMEGGEHDRLSDLNCFWGAIDPTYPKDIWKRSEWRGGNFKNYSHMDLFYVGYGGNKNRTTRFRRYYGELVESDPAKNRAVIKEYLDPSDLLKPNQWMRVVITVEGGRTTYSMDGKELFSHPLEKGQDEGYFGLRLLRNHTIVKDFKIKPNK